MPSASIRILALLCLGIVIMNGMKCFFRNLMHASQVVSYSQVKQSNNLLPSSVDEKYPEVLWTGLYSPPNGTVLHKVAIIVPYRDREKHLATFLDHIHPFLMKQRIEYRIFIIEQKGTLPFNRGKLLNVGFTETRKDWPCFVFHDVDLLPLDDRNIYSCPTQPRHMSAAVDVLNFKLPYDSLFGGVTAFTREQFEKVNGYSNRYWGWGGEDDDMAHRLKKTKYHITRYNMSVARYSMLGHDKSQSVPNRKTHALLLQSGKTFKQDGLSSLNYELLKTEFHHLYTRLLVLIDEQPQDNIRTSYYSNMLFGDQW